MSQHRALVLAALTLSAWSLGACTLRDSTATPEPTAERVQATPLPAETFTPTPTDTPTATATPLPSATPPPRPEPSGPEATLAALEVRCDVPTGPDLITVTLPADVPEESRRAWDESAEHSFPAEVVGHDPVARVYRLRPKVSPPEHEIDVAYSGEAWPLEMGRTYDVAVWSDPPGAPPSGRAIRIEDEEGPVLLVVNVRETESASQRILGGDRAGFAVRQAPSFCRTGPLGPCGYQLRAAPLEVGMGDLWLALSAGTSGAFGTTPPYIVSVSTSHHRVPVGVVACPNPTDWVQSYRIARGPRPEPQPGAETPGAGTPGP